MSSNPRNCMYGLTAEFEDAESLLAAAKKARAAGYKKVEAYSPYWVEGLADTLGHRVNVLPYLVVVMLFVGAALGFYLQFYTDVFDYPLIVGGRPYNSWPAFMLITFEAGILFAALTAVIGLFIQAGLPLPYHPIFNAPNIEGASRNQFFLCILTTDRQFQMTRTREFLQGLEPKAVSEVSC